MTNKIPEIGKSYRWIDKSSVDKLGGVYVYIDWFSPEIGWFECISGWEEGIIEGQDLENFWKYFEEMPKQEPLPTKPE